MSTGWFLHGVILPFIYGGWWSEQRIPLLTNQDAIEWHRDFEHCSIGMSWGWYSQSRHMMFGCGWPSKWSHSWRDNDDKQLEVEVITLFSSHLPIPTIATLKCYQSVFFWMSFLQKGECRLAPAKVMILVQTSPRGQVRVTPRAGWFRMDDPTKMILNDLYI